MKYTVYVGGVEVNSFYLSSKEAKQLAQIYKMDGYTDVKIVKIK